MVVGSAGYLVIDVESRRLYDEDDGDADVAVWTGIISNKVLDDLRCCGVFYGDMCGEEAGYLYSQEHEQYWSQR